MSCENHINPNMVTLNVPVSVKITVLVLKINTWWISSEMWCHKYENRATYQSRFFIGQ